MSQIYLLPEIKNPKILKFFKNFLKFSLKSRFLVKKLAKIELVPAKSLEKFRRFF